MWREIESEIEKSRRKILAAIAGALEITLIRTLDTIGDELTYAGARQLLRGLKYRETVADFLDRARGDLAGAIAEYRNLLTPSVESKWVSVLEPRYILELARLLEKTGDKRSALTEYQRFLELWKSADPDLPELNEARQAVQRLHMPRTN